MITDMQKQLFISEDLGIPEGLTPLGKKAVETLQQFLIKEDSTNTGGCKAFYSPKQWLERGEQYGCNSLLIVCHDGGDLAPYCNWAYDSPALMDSLKAELEKIGVYIEQCTSWYSAIYKS